MQSLGGTALYHGYASQYMASSTKATSNKGTIFDEKRDFKRPIFKQNMDQFKKKGPLFQIL